MTPKKKKKPTSVETIHTLCSYLHADKFVVVAMSLSDVSCVIYTQNSDVQV